MLFRSYYNYHNKTAIIMISIIIKIAMIIIMIKIKTVMIQPHWVRPALEKFEASPIMVRYGKSGR